MPQTIRDSGFLQHLLPRFALKFGVRIEQVSENGDAVIGIEGPPVFKGLGQIWALSHNGTEGPVMFEAWLQSDIGQRTIEAYAPDGTAPFTAQITEAVDLPAQTFEGDVAAGEILALRHCGRCHVINETNRMKGMGQTPSFALMRTFEDWQFRYSAFFTLNPHPSFTQITGLTDDFDPSRPPAIFPLEITPEELDAILAYVATIPPANLGAPLQSQ